MREIKYIVVHCTGGNQDATVEDLKKEFEIKGWKRSGYHFFIDKHGTLHQLEAVKNIANGVKNYNQNSIHIAWAGGLNGKDNRTPVQKQVLLISVATLKFCYPNAEIVGHRDLDPKKACPCFDINQELLKNLL